VHPTLTVLSWNVENLAPYLAADSPLPLSSVLSGFGGPQIVCLQEIRIRPDDQTLIERMRKTLPEYDCHFSLCRDKRNVTFRGGRMYGVVTCVLRSLGAVHEPNFDWDLEGRVVMTSLPRHDLALGNVYAVNGTDKPYWDHELERFEGDRHAFKRRWLERLKAECQSPPMRGKRLLLTGDWNISRTKLDTYPRLRTEEPHTLARALFNDTFLPDLHLVDLFRHLHPTARKYTWHNRQARPGKLDAARVDFALASEDLLPSVIEADILDEPQARHRSDHAPLYVELRL
jgi:exodeoxyribonuclease III